MNLILVIESKARSYDYYMTRCSNEILNNVLFARICKSWRVILIWIHLNKYISKESDDHLSWCETGYNACGGNSPSMHEIASILRMGLRVVAIEFSTSSAIGEYWTSYVTRDWEHAWWWTSAEVWNDPRVMLQSKSPLSLFPVQSHPWDDIAIRVFSPIKLDRCWFVFVDFCLRWLS